MYTLWICMCFFSDYNLVEICRPSPKQLWLLDLTMVFRVLLGADMASFIKNTAAVGSGPSWIEDSPWFTLCSGAVSGRFNLKITPWH